MSKFIPVEKIRKLREAARSGDVRAKKILDMQLSGEEDFSSLLDEYFTPVKENPAHPLESSNKELTAKSKLQEFLDYNQISEDNPEYKDYVEDFYRENPEERMADEAHEGQCECKETLEKLKKDEVDAIDAYSKAITVIMGSSGMEESKKRRVIARLKEIRADEEEHFREIGELLSMDAKEEE